MVARGASSMLLGLIAFAQAPFFGGQATPEPCLTGVRAYVRVYDLATPGLSAPKPLNEPQVPAATMRELGGFVELDITVGPDGYVRDGIVKNSRGGQRVEAAAMRAAANSRFQPGTMNGSPVPVRMPLVFNVSPR